MNDNLTDEKYWEEFWQAIKLPVVAKPPVCVDSLFRKYIPESKLSIFEVGCAPGGWLVYFNQEFNFTVSGIEYAKKAAEFTKHNLRNCGIESEVIFGDFFTFQPLTTYDIVFSRGFIEHFQNYTHTLEKISHLSHKYVITVIPNLLGINGLISRIFRPKVYAKHILISLTQLKQSHEEIGLKTLYCDYSPEFKISLPFEKNDFSKRHPMLSKILNYPIKLINRAANVLIDIFKIRVRSKIFSPSLICIAIKT